MKRKTSTTPTRIWTFGAQAPTVNADVVESQLQLARKYRNVLITIEHQRRADITAVQMAFGDINALQTAITEAVTRVEEMRKGIKTARAAARSKAAVDTKAAAALIKDLLTSIKEMRAALKECKIKLRTDNSALAGYAAATATAHTALLAARAASGLYWGTYQLVELAHQQICKSHTPPKFRRWRGDGRVGVQIQGGMGIADLANDTRLQIVDAPPRAAGTHNKAKLPRTNLERYRSEAKLVRIRVGSKGQLPIFAEFPITLHRKLPLDTIIKGAWVSRTRVADKFKWELQLQLESISAIRVPLQNDARGIVAIDVGWRLRPCGGLRVAYWHDDVGNHGEYILPAKISSAIAHAADLQSIRDLRFDKMRATVTAWGAQTDISLPTWLTEELAHMAKWKAATRLQQLAWRWRRTRFDGDVEIFAELEAFAHKDRHLWQWQINEARKAQLHREACYRNFARDLRERYKIVVLEKLDLRDFAKDAAPEATQDQEAKQVRTNRRNAAISVLRDCIKHAVTVQLVPAARTTITCHVCQHTTKFDAARELIFRCENCGHTQDQDHNAAQNILAAWASGAALPEAGEALEPPNLLQLQSDMQDTAPATL